MLEHVAIILNFSNSMVRANSQDKFRPVFSRFLDLRGNLGIVEEKPARKTCFPVKRSA